MSQAWWYMPVIPALWRQRQEDKELEAPGSNKQTNKQSPSENHQGTPWSNGPESESSSAHSFTQSFIHLFTAHTAAYTVRPHLGYKNSQTQTVPSGA
jgi:hypothetical protein